MIPKARWLLAIALVGCAPDATDKSPDDDGNDTDLPAPEPYFYVLIQDTSPAVGIADPGTDIAKVQLKTDDGKENVGFIVDSEIGLLNNQHSDPTEIIGGGSSDCDDGYVSLGENGWVLFGFGEEGSALDMLLGDSLQVHLISPASCANHDLDTTIELSVGRPTNTDAFEVVEPKDDTEWEPRKFDIPR